MEGRIIKNHGRIMPFPGRRKQPVLRYGLQMKTASTELWFANEEM